MVMLATKQKRPIWRRRPKIARRELAAGSEPKPRAIADSATASRPSSSPPSQRANSTAARKSKNGLESRTGKKRYKHRARATAAKAAL